VLSRAEQLAGPRDNGAVVACYYSLSYAGFAAPYLADGLNGMLGRAGALVAVAGLAVLLAAWMGAGSRAAGVSSAVGEPAGRPRRASVR
jgi:hypothetical protein